MTERIQAEHPPTIRACRTTLPTFHDRTTSTTGNPERLALANPLAKVPNLVPLTDTIEPFPIRDGRLDRANKIDPTRECFYRPG